MRHIPSPEDEHSEAFDACISNIRDAATVQILTNAKQHIINAGGHFLHTIAAGQLSTILPSTTVDGVEMKQQLVKLYTDKLSKIGQPGRIYYDKWRALSPNNRCPLCSVKPVSTLDHYLSKSDFPIYALFPFNLIPACRDCNTEKLAHIATQYAEETLHPYFDNIDQVQWLKARVNHTRPASFAFYVDPVQGWNPQMTDRVSKHMEVFKLYDLFSDHAAEELSNITLRLQKLFLAGGPAAVQEHLFDCMESCEQVSLNSWRTAAYKAMHESIWFHSNGY